MPKCIWIRSSITIGSGISLWCLHRLLDVWIHLSGPIRFPHGCFYQMQTDRNALHVRDRLHESLHTAVTGWVTSCNHWGGHGALSCYCFDDETESPFVRCQEVCFKISLVSRWGRCTNNMTVSPLHQAWNTLLCCRSFMSIGSLTAISIRRPIALLKCKNARAIE